MESTSHQYKIEETMEMETDFSTFSLGNYEAIEPVDCAPSEYC